MTSPQLDDLAAKASALLREGRNAEAIAMLLAQPHRSSRATDYLCDAYFQQRDWARAYAVLQSLLASEPATLYRERLEIVILSNWGQYAQARDKVELFLQRHPGDIKALSVAKTICLKLGETASAVRYGQLCISGKDRLATTLGGKSRSLKPNKDGCRMIALSVWGANPVYTLGAALNVQLAAQNLPGWQVRIYAASGVATDILELYRRLGAEVVLADLAFPDVPAYCWRFLVADDPGVQRFLCRDADCRIGPEEARIVDAWLSSGKRFHVLRDHVLHDDLILAGMWGGIGSRDLAMRSLLSAYFGGKPTNKYGHDQIFLGRDVWPLVRPSVLVHDRHYWTPGVKSHDHGQRFVFAQGHQNARMVEAEARAAGLL